MSSGEIRVIGADDLRAIKAEWGRLWAAVPDASPFQSPAWLLAWAEVYAPGRCRAAALWRDGKLAALVPAFLWEGSLLLAGTGPSDHHSALFVPGAEAAACELLVALAHGTPEPFSRIDLQQLSPDSPVASVKLEGFTVADHVGDPCLFLRLHGAEGMAAVPKRICSNWRYAMRRLEREGARLEIVAPEQAAEATAELARLHAIRWRAEGEDGVLADEFAERHLSRAIPELAGAGLLRMHRLRHREETVAILLAMRGVQSTCYYLSGFDPAWASLSPGTALIGAAIAQAAAEGCTGFDFLRGEEEYKYRWGAEDRPRLRRVFTRS